MIKEALKWELEIVERKTEDRFREMEQLIKKVGIKIDQKTQIIVNDTSNEFQNIKGQFEEFGNTIYEKMSSEVQDKINMTLAKSLIELQESLNTDLTIFVHDQQKPLQIKLAAIES